MNVIFLDIDGVLNHRPDKELWGRFKMRWTKEVENEIVGLHPPLVANLKRIIDTTRASIVFSTTWRYFKDHPTVGDDWKKTLSEMLGCHSVSFLGDTPIYAGMDKDRRGIEIKDWIMANLEPGKFKYCVIDDDIRDIVGIIPEKNVFKTDENVGLDSVTADKIIEYFS